MLCGLVHGERTAQAALYEVPCSARGTQRAVDVHRSQESACLDARDAHFVVNAAFKLVVGNLSSETFATFPLFPVVV